MLTQVTKQAADHVALTKLAAITEMPAATLKGLADRLRLSPSDLTKCAFDNPDGFVAVLKAHMGGKLTQAEKTAGLGSKLLQGLSTMGTKATDGALYAANKGANVVQDAGHMAGQAAGGLKAGAKAVGSKLGEPGVNNAALAGAGGVAAGLGSQMAGKALGGGEAPPAGPISAAVQQATAPPPVLPGAAGGVAGAPGNSPQGSPTGLSPLLKALLVGGGVGAGALGAGALVKNRSKKKQPVKTAAEALHTVFVKRAAELFRKEVADVFVRYLDVVCGTMPLEKTAQVRTVQKCVIEGMDLSYAIKVAYPQLSGEQRGILGADMVKRAAAWNKRANAAIPTVGEQSWSGPASGAGEQMRKMAAETKPEKDWGTEKRANPALMGILKMLKSRGGMAMMGAGAGGAGLGAMMGGETKAPTMPSGPGLQMPPAKNPISPVNKALGGK